MSKTKDTTQEIMLDMDITGQVYTDNHNGQNRILIENFSGDEKQEEELRIRIINMLGSCNIYI